MDVLPFLLIGCLGGPEAPSVQAFYADPSTISPGQTAVLHWSVTNAQEVVIEGIGPVALQGSLPVSPSNTTVYTLIATGPGGTVSATAVVVVEAPSGTSKEQPSPSGSEEQSPSEGQAEPQTPPETPTGQPPEILMFEITPPEITAGESAVISWSVTNAEEVLLNDQQVETSGTLEVSPSQNTTYLLLARNAYGEVQETLTLTVIPTVVCGDGVCEGEGDCCYDCGCPEGLVCEEGECVEVPANASPADLPTDIILQLPEDFFSGSAIFPGGGPLTTLPVCGDGICSPGENETNCCEDCGCPLGSICSPPIGCIPIQVPLPILSGFLPTWLGQLNLTEDTSPAEEVAVYTEEAGVLKGIGLEKYGDTYRVNLLVSSMPSEVKIHFANAQYPDPIYTITVSPSSYSLRRNADGAVMASGEVTCQEEKCYFELPSSKWPLGYLFWVAVPSTGDRLPAKVGLEFNATSFSLSRGHVGKPYVVVLLESYKVLDDTDPAAEGEIMLVATGASGNLKRRVGFPLKIWFEMNSGDMALGGTENAVPIFAAEESDMGDNLALVISAADNDELPGWLEDSFDVLTSKIFLQLLSDVTGAKEEVLEHIAQAVDAVRDWWGDNEEIGTYYNVFSKDEDWGIRETPYDGLADDLLVRYRVQRVYVPEDLRARVRLYGIRIDSCADSNWECCSWWTTTGGEFFSWMRVADDFAGNDLAQRITRCPESGTTCVCNGWVKCPTYDKEDFGERPKFMTLFDDSLSGPFLYVEIAGWDEDEPAVGDDHDPLGTVAKTWLLDEDNFEWELSSLRPKPWTIDRMVSVRGVSGGKMTVDLGVEISPE